MARNASSAARKAGDSLGGVVEAVARGVPPGLGEPVFDKLDADLAKALLSLPACRGFEIGSGFAGTRMTGSTHNDPFYMDRGRIPAARRVRTRSNRSGGVQGGISNGEAIVVRAAFKPTATILRPQQTVDEAGNEVTLKPARPPRPLRAAARRAAGGRHVQPSAGRTTCCATEAQSRQQQADRPLQLHRPRQAGMAVLVVAVSAPPANRRRRPPLRPPARGPGPGRRAWPG